MRSTNSTCHHTPPPEIPALSQSGILTPLRLHCFLTRSLGCHSRRNAFAAPLPLVNIGSLVLRSERFWLPWKCPPSSWLIDSLVDHEGIVPTIHTLIYTHTYTHLFCISCRTYWFSVLHNTHKTENTVKFPKKKKNAPSRWYHDHSCHAFESVRTPNPGSLS